MYQSFTGSGRRPKQINLSGRPTNPFASSPVGGTNAAVASAQQERAHRQQQRERLSASTRIQRVWRGHSTRRRTFKIWRETWDDIEANESSKTLDDGAYRTEGDSLGQLRRLLLFYQPTEDVRRLTRYGRRQMATASRVETPCSGNAWSEAYPRLSRACTTALRTRSYQPDEEIDRTLLTVLAYSVQQMEGFDSQDAMLYYDTLTALQDAPADALQKALIAPLKNSSEAYVGLAVLLATPLDQIMLKLLQSVIDPFALFGVLEDQVMQGRVSTVRSRLWLLGNLIALTGPSTDARYISCVSQLLGSLADEVDFESAPALGSTFAAPDPKDAVNSVYGNTAESNITFDHEVLAKLSTNLPLNTYLRQQIVSLINQDSIRNLLAKKDGANAQLLAGYALTLLRCFPRRADDIRMWLYLGPTAQVSSDTPATQYFWDAAKTSTIFSTIWHNSRTAMSLLKLTQPTRQQIDDWTVIMVFLELYTFLLKIMDDEEFMGRGSRRNGTIPVGDVGDLVTFLKSLGFTLHFNSSELTTAGDVRDSSDTSLGRHFGKTTDSAATTTALTPEDIKPLTLAGLPGLTIDYLKGLVTGLLRAIYERDSRRHFLPANHWLMTDRFDMSAFIPGVVAEEESRHQIQEQDDDDREDSESDDDTDEVQVLPGQPHAGPRRINGGYANLLRSQNARERAQRKASRKRYLESVAPRLEILQNLPFFIPFVTRVEIFRQFVQLDQTKRRNGYVDPDLWRQSIMFAPPNGLPPREQLARHHATIQRKNEFADAMEHFWELGPDFKEPIQITFVDEFGIQEAGIDGGGVTKEFLTSVVSQMFTPTQRNAEPAYFEENDKHLLYIRPAAVDEIRALYRANGFKGHDVKDRIKLYLSEFEFLGRIIGKCMYEGILVDVNFAGFFLKKWALTGGTNSAPMESGYRANINDLRELDEGLYRGLLALKNAPAEQVEEFGLTFTVDDVVGPETHATIRREVISRELIPGGANTAVTAENRLVYINRMSWYRLQGQSAMQTNAFLKGLSSIVQPSWLSMFNQSELQTLIGGAAAEINITDLRRNTLYGGTYVIGDDGQEHPSVQLFWHVMAKLPDAQRRKVVKFVTSTPRGPLLGFSQLNPRFSIRDSGADENRLPSTSTCVNLLKLPMYRSEEVLRAKLLAAVESGAGFDLS